MRRPTKNHQSSILNPQLAFIVAALLFLLLPISGQTSLGDETPEETLSRSSRNLHQWGTISSFHGLPSEIVRAIAQTSDGFIWFGTENGLARFDGRRVQTNVFADLASVPVFALETSPKGVLWIGTEKGAFYVEEGNVKLLKPTQNNKITSISLLQESVLLTTDKGVVFEGTDDGNDFSASTLVSDDIPLQTAVRDGDDILLGTLNRGLLKIKVGKTENLLTRPRPFFINVLKRDKQGHLWLGARSSSGSSGLFYSERLPALEVVGSDIGTVNSISFDGFGNTWIGSDSRGVFLFKGKEMQKRFSFANTFGSLRSDNILAILVDREGVIWIGTDEGVNRFDPMSPRNERVSDNTQSNFVRILRSAKDGRLLAGTNRGLYSSGSENTGWKNEITNQTVYVIEPAGNGKWYIGTPDGLLLFDERDRSTNVLLEEKDVRAVTNFRGKVYAAVFGEGLVEVKDQSTRVVDKGNVVSVFREGDTKLWFGTTDGILRTFDGLKVSEDIVFSGDSKPAIWSITGTTDKGIWISTNIGLFLLKGNVVQPLLKNSNIRETLVIRDENNSESIWCAGEEGLFTLKFEPNFGWISSRSDIEQGFASQNMFSLTTADRALIIATNRGIVRKDVGTIKPFIIVNRILSQRLHLPSELNSGINLEYPQNTLSVEVTALSSRTFPEEFQYSFLLFNEAGDIVTKRFSDKEEFLMDSLDPGKYRVEIRAYDRNLTSSEPFSFEISVSDAPFPLIATILGVLLLIAIAALIWATFSQRKIFRTSRQLAFANKELNSARLSLANEAERERHRIARDLHDQTLADLRHLILMADDVSTERAPEFRSEIEGISDEIRRICEDLSPSVLENIGFTASLEWELGNAVEQFDETHEIETHFSADENLEDNLELNRAEQIQIYRIAQEILNNLVRHARPSKIDLTVKRSESGGIRLLIRDDGPGFEPADSTNKKGRGLANIQARAQLIKAEIAWTKLKDGRGTEFSLTK